MCCRRIQIATLIFVLVLASHAIAGCTRAPSNGTPAQIVIERIESGYLFREGSDSVLVYRHEVVRPGHVHARSHYVHPLYSLSGAGLTVDFPADHPHQHGIFWAWHQVEVEGRRIGDAWIQDGVEWTVRDVEMLDDLAAPALRAHVEWTSPNYLDDAGRPVPFIEETATIQVHAAKAGFRSIDFTIAVRALAEGVRLGGSEDVKGYGGFSAHVRLPGDVRFTGQGGLVQPEDTEVLAGPWVDITGTIDENGPSGIAIFQHPDNPGYPNPWILRSEASMQNVKWPGAEPYLLPQDEVVVLRYRLIVHEGGTDAAIMQHAYEAYSANER